MDKYQELRKEATQRLQKMFERANIRIPDYIDVATFVERIVECAIIRLVESKIATTWLCPFRVGDRVRLKDFIGFSIQPTDGIVESIDYQKKSILVSIPSMEKKDCRYLVIVEDMDRLEEVL
jgi:hypothetical protein